MKFLIISLALAAVAHSAEYQTGYKDPNYPGTFKNAAIVRQISEQSADGGYNWSYDTENGISASEAGALSAVGPDGKPAIEAQGGYRYTAPDGQVIEVRYIAGPGGFVAEGAHLPVAPPIPEAILRSLAFNAANPQKEDTEYYKPEPQKPYYPTVSTPKPLYYPSSVKPTYQPSFYKPTYQPTLQPTFQPYSKPAGFAQAPAAARR